MWEQFLEAMNKPKLFHSMADDGVILLFILGFAVVAGLLYFIGNGVYRLFKKDR